MEIKRWCNLEYWRRESENGTWQLTGIQGMIDSTGNYRLCLWIPLSLNMDIFSFHRNFESSETITTHTAHRPAAAFSYAADSPESLADA